MRLFVVTIYPAPYKGRIKTQAKHVYVLAGEHAEACRLARAEHGEGDDLATIARASGGMEMSYGRCAVSRREVEVFAARGEYRHDHAA